MGNTNFQTIHQMGTAISNMVKQATGRDDVQNIDMEHITVAQNHHYEEIDLRGQVVSFQAGEAGLPFEKMVVQIKPVQSGSGDPSPDNIRPITGWTMVNVYQAGQNMEDARVFRFPFPSEAGTVYGGTLDVISGALTVDMTMVDMGTLTWQKSGTNDNGFYSRLRSNVYALNNVTMICEMYKFDGAILTDYYKNENIRCYKRLADTAPAEIYVMDDRFTDVALFINAMSGVKLVYELATPLSFHLSPQEITTLLGQNHIWADTGDIEVKFTNVKEMY